MMLHPLEGRWARWYGSVMACSGRQLELELDDVRRAVPWDGRSPRELTRVWKTFSLGAPPTGGLHAALKSAHYVEGWADPAQLLLFVRGG